MAPNIPPTWQDKLDAILAKNQTSPIVITDDELPNVEDILSDPKNYALLKQKYEELKKLLLNNINNFDADSCKRLETFIETCENELGRWNRKLDAILAKDQTSPIVITDDELPNVEEILSDPKNYALLKEKYDELKKLLLNNIKSFDAKTGSRKRLETFIKTCENELCRWDRKLDAILAMESSSPISIKPFYLPEYDILDDPNIVSPLKDKLKKLKQFLSDFHDDFDADSRKRLETFIKTCENELGRWDHKLDLVLATLASPKIFIPNKLPNTKRIFKDPKNLALLKEKVESIRSLLLNSNIVIDKTCFNDLDDFVRDCENRLSQWDCKLDAILARDLSSPIAMSAGDLPTVGEIVKNKENIAKLKGYVERLKYFRLDPRLDDVSRGHLEMFITNCEKAFFDQEQKKEPYLNQILKGEKWLSAGLAVMLVVVLVIPVLICIFTGKNGFYTDSMQMERELHFGHERLLNSKPDGPAEKAKKPADGPAEKAKKPADGPAEKAKKPADGPAEKAKKPADGPAGKTEKPADDPAGKKESSNGVKTSTSSKYHSVSHANWVAILGFALFVFVYIVFVVMLAILFFKTLKKIRQHQHRQILHDDLSSLASLMAVKIESNDATGLEMRKRIMRIMMPDDTED